jgi:rfaE bifunctional protein nucleotidyltransferase chain/domain
MIGSGKLLSLQQMQEERKKLRESGKKLVFTNGCFDIIHRGHVGYLKEARNLGDALVVALNSDSSVRLLGKGDDRPFNNEQDRAELLCALRSVDYVVIFSEKTATKMIEAIQPDIYVKGGDYKLDEIIEMPAVLAGGGDGRVLGVWDGYATTDLVDKIRNC